MIILALLFLFDSLSDVKRPFYQAEHPIAIGNEKISERKNTQLPYMVIECSSPAFLKLKNDIAYKLYRIKLQSKKDHIWSFSPLKFLDIC